MSARFTELGTAQTPACHFTTEVFLREQGKWAVVDATPLKEYEVYYTVDGVPQSALDMHRHVVNGTMDDAGRTVVWRDQRKSQRPQRLRNCLHFAGN